MFTPFTCAFTYAFTYTLLTLLPHPLLSLFSLWSELLDDYLLTCVCVFLWCFAEASCCRRLLSIWCITRRMLLLRVFLILWLSRSFAWRLCLRRIIWRFSEFIHLGFLRLNHSHKLCRDKRDISGWLSSSALPIFPLSPLLWRMGFIS